MSRAPAPEQDPSIVGLQRSKMAKKKFPDEWEKLTKEEMINARARLSGFIESTNEKEKTIRDVSIRIY